MENFSQVYKSFLDTVKICQTVHKNQSSEIVMHEQATQDLLHQLELGSYKERAKTTTLLAKTRKARRASKDVVQLLQPFIDLLNTQEGIKFIRQLQIVLGETRKIENNMSNRRYTPRVITDLEIARLSEADNEKKN